MTSRTPITGEEVADVLGGKFVIARVPHRCTISSWHHGCGRNIAKGERYLSFKRGALSTFAVCSDCSAATAARQQEQSHEA